MPRRRRTARPEYLRTGDDFDGGTVIQSYVYPFRPEMGVVLYHVRGYNNRMDNGKFRVAESNLVGDRRFRYSSLISEFDGDEGLTQALIEYNKRVALAFDQSALTTKYTPAELEESITHLEWMMKRARDWRQNIEECYGDDAEQVRDSATIEYARVETDMGEWIITLRNALRWDDDLTREGSL